MEVAQIYDVTNKVTKEVLGEEAVLNEDLSNIVDIGEQVIGQNQVDNYVRKLIDRIGKTVFVNRPYEGSAPSVLMDGWEYGSVLQKLTMDKIPDAQENESWELKNGTSYDPNIFNGPEVSAKYFNSKTTFEVPMSFPKMQVNEAFTSAEQVNAFESMIQTAIDKSITVKTDALVMRTINNMIGETLHDFASDGNYSGKSGQRAINLLYLYNQQYGTELTPTQARLNPEFIRFAIFTIALYQDRLRKVSTLFNIGGKDRFTTPDFRHTVLLAEFAKAAGVYLYDGTGQFRTDNLSIGDFETVPYWQGSGLDYGFNSTSKIDIKTGSGNTVTASGILGVVFDRDALGVCNQNRRTLSQPNNKAEFYNFWYKVDSSYFNDTNENFLVFYIA